MYLKNQDKEILVYLACIFGYFSTNIDKSFLNDVEKDYAKEIIKHLDLLISSINKRLDKDFTKVLLKVIKETEVMLVPKQEALRLKHVNKTLKTEILVNDLEEMAGLLLDNCNMCSVKNYKKCRFRQIFMRVGIDKFDSEAIGVCQYKIT